MPRSTITTRFAFEETNATVLQRVNRGVSQFSAFVFSPAGAVAGAAALGAAIAGVTGRYLENADALQKMSLRTGIGTEDLGALKFAFEQADLSGDDLQRTISRLNDRGLSLDEFADQIAGIDDIGERTSRTIDVLGERLGPRLLSVLDQGSEGLDRYRQQHERLGLAIDQESAEAAARFNDNVDTIQRVVEGAGNRIGQAVINWGGPILEGAAKAFGILPPEAGLRTEQVIEEFVSRYGSARNAGASFGDALADPVIDRLSRLLEEAGYTIDEILDLPNQARARERFQDEILRDQTRDRLFGPLHPEDASPEASSEAYAAAARIHLGYLARGVDPTVGRGIGAADEIAIRRDIPDVDRAIQGIFATSQFDRILNAHVIRQGGVEPGAFANGYRTVGGRAAEAGDASVPVRIVGGAELIDQTRSLIAQELLRDEADLSTFQLRQRAEAFAESRAGEVQGLDGSRGGGFGGGAIDGQSLIDASKDDPVRVTIAALGGLNEGAADRQKLREIRVDDELINRDALVEVILALLQDHNVI